EGTCLTVYQPNGLKAQRIVLVGLGKPEKLDLGKYKKSCAAAAQSIKNNGAVEIGVCLPEVEVQHHNLYSKIRCTIETMDAAQYSFDAFKSKKADEPEKPEQTLSFHRETTTQGQVDAAIEHAAAIAAGVKLTRDLANTPPNVCNPKYMAEK